MLKVHDGEIPGLIASPRMDFNFNPSLSSRAAITATVALWYHEDVFSLRKLHQFIFRNEENIFRNEENHHQNVIQNVRNLVIPEHLKEIILLNVRSIKNQLICWEMKNGKFLPNDASAYNDLIWTSIGVIDYTKTANNILKRGNLPPVDAFKLACVNCIVEKIFELWPVVQYHNFDLSTSPFNMHPEVGLWVRHLQDTEPAYYKQRSFVFEGFGSAFYFGNMPSLKFFFDQLTQFADREVFFKSVKQLLSSVYTDSKTLILLFLLSSMEGTQQNEYFKNNPMNILLCFLKWPLQHFFLQVADKVWDCLTENDFFQVIRVMLKKMLMYDCEAPLYRKLSMEFWSRSPINLRNDFLKERFHIILRNLFFPHEVNHALNILFPGACDEEILYKSCIEDAKAVMLFISTQDKPKAFKILARKFIPSDDSSLKNFEESFAHFSKNYVISLDCIKGFDAQWLAVR